jgi:hypothetical protein
VRAFEQVAVSALAEAIHAVERIVAGRPPGVLAEPLPTAGDRAAAAAAIRALACAERLTAREADQRQDRLAGLADAAIRLRTLIELHGRGHVSTPDLASRRERVVETLARSLAPRD